MTAPSISVVIPAYNASGTIVRAIRSVERQVFDGAMEIIVVDDASTDGLAEAIRGLSVSFVSLSENVGPALALKAGVEAATYDLVAFLDADDEWLPGKLQAQVAALAARPDAVVVATAFTRVRRDGRLEWTYGEAPFSAPPEAFWKLLLGEAAILKSSALVRRDAVLASGALDSGLRAGEDQALFLALAATGPVAYVSEPFVLYHDQPGSLTDRFDTAKVREALRLNLAAIERFRDRLTAAERRALVGRRQAEAARSLIPAGAWGPGLAATARAIAAGHEPGANLWRVATNAPPVRALKRLLRR